MEDSVRVVSRDLVKALHRFLRGTPMVDLAAADPPVLAVEVIKIVVALEAVQKVVALEARLALVEQILPRQDSAEAAE